MASKSVVKGTIGRLVVLDTKIDLTPYAGDTVQILVERPDRTTTTWAATIQNPPTNQKIEHELATGDVDQKGTYNLHANIISATKNLIGDHTTLEVRGLYESNR